MYEGKRPDEMCCVAVNCEPDSICTKAKRIHDLSSEVNEIAARIQQTMFADNGIPHTPPKEPTCLDDELNAIWEEMQYLRETLSLINRRLWGNAE